MVQRWPSDGHGSVLCTSAPLVERCRKLPPEVSLRFFSLFSASTSPCLPRSLPTCRSCPQNSCYAHHSCPRIDSFSMLTCWLPTKSATKYDGNSNFSPANWPKCSILFWDLPVLTDRVRRSIGSLGWKWTHSGGDAMPSIKFRSNLGLA